MLNVKDKLMQKVDLQDLKLKLLKFIRFSRIYGFQRAYVKSAGRMRSSFFLKLPISFNSSRRDIGIIGCGQFAFSTISFFIKKSRGSSILGCYDIVRNNSLSLASYYNAKVYENVQELLDNIKLRTIYIASNHHSHTDYAIESLKRNLNVYVEKPVSVNHHQFIRLTYWIKKSQGNIYAGYNRPYSKAIQELKRYINNSNAPISMTCFIVGHKLPEDHWYRLPQEGTRICGNLGHWIDLTVHFFFIRGLPEVLNIQIVYSNLKEPDDNVSIILATEYGDIINLLLSSRSEPFEGINETISFQCDDVICKIDDFRSMTIRRGHSLVKRKFKTKDVGHQRAVLQPFIKNNREWGEVELSTLIMLKITSLVNKLERSYDFNIKNELAQFKAQVGEIKE